MRQGRVVAICLAAAVAALGCGEDGDQGGCQDRDIIHVGEGPEGIAVGAGRVWVTNRRDGTVTTIDPTTCKVTGDPIRVGKRPQGIAVGEGAVWVALGSGSVVRIDPRRRAVSGDPIRTGGGPYGIAVGEGSVWVTHLDRVDEHEVTRIPVNTLRPQGIAYPPRARRRREQGPAGVAVGAGAVWVANEGGNSVTRLDPATGRVEGRAVRVQYPSAVAVRGTELWVAGGPGLTRIDARTGAVLGTVGVGGSPSALAVSGDAIWLPLFDQDHVVRVDARSRRRVGHAIDVGSEPVAIAAGAGALWVANAASGTVTRFEP